MTQMDNVTMTHCLEDIPFNDLPEEVRDKAKYFLLDFLGVSICGTKSDSSEVFYNFIRRK